MGPLVVKPPRMTVTALAPKGLEATAMVNTPELYASELSVTAEGAAQAGLHVMLVKVGVTALK